MRAKPNEANPVLFSSRFSGSRRRVAPRDDGEALDRFVPTLLATTERAGILPLAKAPKRQMSIRAGFVPVLRLAVSF
jgi:hypothetical protein